MSGTISADEFLAADGVGAWSAAGGTATATFATGSFARGVELAVEIGRLADEADHHPDIDLRYPSVTVRLTSHDVGGLSDRDVRLARAVSAAAAELGILPESAGDTATGTEPAATPDEHLWLEDIHGEAPLAWAAEQSRATLAAFESPAFDELAGRLREVLDSDDRIPLVSKHGDHYYNLWRDREHPRGLWRRTTLDGYRNERPEWEILLDVDALGRDESTEWVFAGARLLPHDHTRALLSLSPDGGDATTIREFDVTRRAFVEGGFVIPTAKSNASWIDLDTLYVGTDTGPGSMTSSSYPRTVRRLRRGETLQESQLVHEVSADDLQAVAWHDHTEGFERDVVVEAVDFYRSRTLVLVDGAFRRVDVPEDADVTLHREWLLVQPRSDWAVDGETLPTGALVAFRFDDFVAGGRSHDILFHPDSRSALESWSFTRDHLVLSVLEDVASSIRVLALPLGEAGWDEVALDGVPPLSTVRVLDTDPDESNELWLHATSFTTPATVLRGVIGSEPLEVVKTSPAFFDASGIEVSQHWAVSDDGTRVPYFQVARGDLVEDGSHPTLLSGYGGFQASRLPDYSGVIGRAWLERGGVFVLANIRGGGEFGPAWHTSALRENRHRAYEDFAAIARDLVTRGVTVPARLACEGRSNGGLLVGNMLTTYPELFGAVVCGVPLLDMQRYTHLSAGASWIAEYGDPDVPADWEFIRTFSPYHLLREGVDYPATLIYAATSDDRVGPVQGRKMAARMQTLGIPGVLYYENDDGGHGGAVDNAHSARLFALMYDFAWRALARG
ncbi:prolyl oligopeptidase family serine peptidase [Frondihabitans sp. 762G35]|uniref:prolyl oligopeptidase family serine peptidase n=1 Tax=Frondihabitans sp. 762G35 TaxID=1446794 RepID=UPI000F4DBBD7|nr:prolyl oligopeptidase family serine peptidase [Frondihabitans sp. 762G35]